MSTSALLILAMCLLVALITSVKDRHLDDDIEEQRKSWEDTKNDYNKVTELIQQGYSDNEIYSKLGNKMLPFLVSDVRKELTK